MAAVYRLKGLGWLATTALAAIGFYLVSSQVAAERKRLEDVDTRITAAKRDIRALETEFDVRANMAQLEKWNAGTLALTATDAGQFVRSEQQLAALAPDGGAVPAPLVGEAPVQTAALLVPAPAPLSPPVSAPLSAPVSVSPSAPSSTAQAGNRLGDGLRTASVKAEHAAGHAETPKRQVAMLDRALLSDSTLTELARSARTERGLR